MDLVSNTVKFTPAGIITVAFSCRDDETLVMAVVDTGIGIPSIVSESNQKHLVSGETMFVFEKMSVFVGLSLLAEMLRFTKGHIEIESGSGVGTTVTFELPCTPVDYPWFPLSGKRIEMLHYVQMERVRDMVRRFTLFYNHKYQAIGSLDDALSQANGNGIEWFARHGDAGRLRDVVVLFLSPRNKAPNASNVEMFPTQSTPTTSGRAASNWRIGSLGAADPHDRQALLPRRRNLRR
jgi:hypothetical protein